MVLAADSSYRERGQAALLMTLSLTALLGAMGLVVDFGWAYWRKEAASTAATAAASAAIAAANSVSNQICGAGADHWNLQQQCGEHHFVRDLHAHHGGAPP
jgi:hypothetical protein